MGEKKKEINGVVQAVDLAKKHDIDSILKAEHNFNLTASWEKIWEYELFAECLPKEYRGKKEAHQQSRHT